MAKAKKECDGQMAIANYRLPQVEVRLRLAEASPLYSAEPMDCPSAAVKAVRQFMQDLDRENVLVVDLDTKLKPVNFSVVSIGSINSSIAPIQNIMKTAILSNCGNIMLFHNHPSGSLEPSREDEVLTRRLAEAGAVNVKNRRLTRKTFGITLMARLRERAKNLYCQTSAPTAVAI